MNMASILRLLATIAMSGFIGPSIGVFAAGFVFWRIGVHNPFFLTLLSCLIGGSAGYCLEIWLAARFLEPPSKKR